MLSGPLHASLLGNLLSGNGEMGTGKDMIRASRNS